jgi:hypothetical protein
MALIELIGRIASTQRHRPEIHTLRRKADRLRQQLVPIDQRLFERIRRGVQTRQLSAQALRRQLDQITAYRRDNPHQAHIGYDGLDVLLRGLLEVEPPPLEKEPDNAEMVHFERTPGCCTPCLKGLRKWLAANPFRCVHMAHAPGGLLSVRGLFQLTRTLTTNSS